MALLAVIRSFRYTFFTDYQGAAFFSLRWRGDGLKDRTQEGSMAERGARWAGALLAVLGAALVMMSVLGETPW